MINDLKIDDLLERVDSRYGLVLASARRARQINEYTATLGLNESLGIPGPQVHTRSQHPLSIAIEELRSGKLEVRFAEPPTRSVAEAAPAEEEDPVEVVGETAAGETAADEAPSEEPSEAVAEAPSETPPEDDPNEDQGAA